MSGQTVSRKEIYADDVISKDGVRMLVRNVDRNGFYYFCHGVNPDNPDQKVKAIALGPGDTVRRYTQ